MPMFDPRPKSSLKDFFNMENELKAFLKAIKISPLTIVLGLRRYGKTSLILTGLNTKGVKYVYVDCKSLPTGMISPSDFAELLVHAISDFSRKHRKLGYTLLRILRNIKGIRVGEFQVNINLRKFSSSSLIELLNGLEELGEEVVLVIDEAQELRRMVRYRADSILAYIYDNLRNVKTVVSGSEIGLLYKLLRIHDPEAPLYGRAYVEIRLKKLSREKSFEFLKLGFKEYGVKVPEETLRYIVDAVDGVIGWLAYIGFKMVSQGKYGREVVDEVLNEASKLALKELESFLHLRPLARERYLAILKAIAILEKASWTRIRNYAQAELGRIPKPSFNSLLRNLMDAGFVVKENSTYKISDPVLEKAIAKLGKTSSKIG